MKESSSRQVPRNFNLHWGNGQIVEEASVESQYHQPSIQLLEFEDGSLSIRFCYYNQHGQFQRGPLIMGKGDVERMRNVISENDRLLQLLRKLVM